jgi:hypothetical protein
MDEDDLRIKLQPRMRSFMIVFLCLLVHGSRDRGIRTGCWGMVMTLDQAQRAEVGQCLERTVTVSCPKQMLF